MSIDHQVLITLQTYTAPLRFLSLGAPIANVNAPPTKNLPLVIETPRNLKVFTMVLLSLSDVTHLALL